MPKYSRLPVLVNRSGVRGLFTNGCNFTNAGGPREHAPLSFGWSGVGLSFTNDCNFTNSEFTNSGSLLYYAVTSLRRDLAAQ